MHKQSSYAMDFHTRQPGIEIKTVAKAKQNNSIQRIKNSPATSSRLTRPAVVKTADEKLKMR
jgi:hypothetical protein